MCEVVVSYFYSQDNKRFSASIIILQFKIVKHEEILFLRINNT